MKALLNRLMVAQKLAIFGALGLLMVVLPLSLYLNETYKDYAFARTERQGIEPARTVLKLLRQAQQHRSLSAAVLGGAAELESQRAAEQQAIEQTIATMLSQQKDALANKKINDAWRRATWHWRSLSNGVTIRSVTVQESNDLHAALSARLLLTLEHVRDQFSLTLDPEADGYFLHIAALLHLPELSELLGQASARGASMLARQTASETERAAMTAAVGRIRALAAEARRSIDKAIEASPDVRNDVGALLTEGSDKVNRVALLAEERVIGVRELTYSSNEFASQYAAAADGVFKLAQAATDALDRVLAARVTGTALTALWLGGFVLLFALAAGAFGVYVARGITQPVSRLHATVQNFAQGNDQVRAHLDTNDELGQLGAAFDRMMDERVATQEGMRGENEKLNSSVLGLLHAVAQLSRRDLTVKVPVTEDITGPVADALNLMAGETAKTLQDVSNISADVTAASLKVKSQSDAVQSAANEQRKQVEASATALDQASQTMTRIAEMAQQCNAAAQRSIATTQQALETVTGTVGGINNTRDTIRETEKRIKRVGERSQEISVAVNLINSIAERTHILALNAAMHAASAGEAGRGFAVVADEVQRLAENARQSTQQIATLVNNIQVETADTVNTMNAAITQVVEGSRLAEQAGRQMQVSQQTNAELVASVSRIAEQSQQQARTTGELAERAGLIKRTTQETTKQLTEQNLQTNLLVEYAKSLLAAVRVFKLSST